MLGTPAPSKESISGRLGSPAAYGVAVTITTAVILSQYSLPRLVPAVAPVYHSLPGGLLIVYGIPIVAFVALVGVRPLTRFFAEPRRATIEGLRWYGLLSLLSLGVLFLVVLLYQWLDPSALQQLQRPNPVLQNARSNPWFWVGFSFVIGIVEETIFRGWIFGYWIARGTSNWRVHAVWTSGLFAGVHLYYGTTYGPAVTFALVQLFFVGLAFAGAVHASRGTLVVVGLLHGAYDAIAFLTLVWSDALVLNYTLILVGALIGLIVFLRRPSPPSPAAPSWAMPTGPPRDVGQNPAIALPPVIRESEKPGNLLGLASEPAPGGRSLLGGSRSGATTFFRPGDTTPTCPRSTPNSGSS